MSDLLQQIAQKRAEKVQDIHLDLPVPTWEGDLVVRFRVIGRDALKRFQKVDKENTDANLDFLIQATSELYVRDADQSVAGVRMEGNDDYVMLQTEAGVPVRWDKELGKKLELPSEATGREILRYTFGENEVAIFSMALRVWGWMQNTDNKVAEAILGE